MPKIVNAISLYNAYGDLNMPRSMGTFIFPFLLTIFTLRHYSYLTMTMCAVLYAQKNESVMHLTQQKLWQAHCLGTLVLPSKLYMCINVYGKTNVPRHPLRTVRKQAPLRYMLKVAVYTHKQRVEPNNVWWCCCFLLPVIPKFLLNYFPEQKGDPHMRLRYGASQDARS